MESSTSICIFLHSNRIHFGPFLLLPSPKCNRICATVLIKTLIKIEQWMREIIANNRRCGARRMTFYKFSQTIIGENNNGKMLPSIRKQRKSRSLVVGIWFLNCLVFLWSIGYFKTSVHMQRNVSIVPLLKSLWMRSQCVFQNSLKCINGWCITSAPIKYRSQKLISECYSYLFDRCLTKYRLHRYQRL